MQWVWVDRVGRWLVGGVCLAVSACSTDGSRGDPSAGQGGWDVPGVQAGATGLGGAAGVAGVAGDDVITPTAGAGAGAAPAPDASQGPGPTVDAGTLPSALDAGVLGVDASAGFDAATTLDAGAADAGPVVRVFDAGSDPDRNAVVAGMLCDRLSEIQCAGEAYCCDAPGRDFAACKSELYAVCQSDLHVDAIAMQAKTGFDASHAEAAITELERLASECDPSIAPFGESLSGLRGMFKGTLSANASCTPGLTTDPVQAGASLASCTDPATQACLPALLGWSCKPRGGVGSSCFTDVNCTDGLYCPNPDLIVGFTNCASRKAVGASCSLPNECASLFCQGGKCVASSVQAAYCL